MEKEKQNNEKLAEAINKMKLLQSSKNKKKKGFLNKISPFTLFLVGITIITLVMFFISNFGNSSPKISLGNFIEKINQNQISDIYIQNNETVVAFEKYFLTLEENEKYKVSLKDTFDLNEGLVEIKTLSDFSNLFFNDTLAEKIKKALITDSNQYDYLFETSDSLLFVESSKNAFKISGFSIDDLEKELSSKGKNLQETGIKIYNVPHSSNEVELSTLQANIDNKEIFNAVSIDGYILAKKNSENVKTFMLDWTSNYATFIDTVLNENDIPVLSDNYSIISANIPVGITLSDILTILSIVGFIILAVVIFRSAQSSGMGVMQFGQSKAKMFFGQKPEITFVDVAGIDEAKEELSEIVDFLKNPGKYRKMGARIPKGILMFGAPGTGKTLLARAIAGEAGVPFFHTSGSEFEEMLVGAGASRVRDLFAKAKKSAPALIFIDEIDAVARKRGTRIQSGSTEQTLNQILVEMDGFEKNVNVIVIAATNRPDVLDNAILRPGRFDRQIRIELPDKEGREEIIRIHSKNKPIDENVDFQKLAGRTVGFSGADLENIMNEAAIIAAKAEQTKVNMQNIDEAISKVILGPAKKSRKRTEAELKLVAYHEAGHALIAKFTEDAIPVDKISIISRGSSGGVTMFTPEKDENIVSKKRLLADIIVSLGGRAAEEVALNDISTGASSDIEKATMVAKNMIQKYGMSNELGMVRYGGSLDSEHLGYAYGDSRDFSDSTAEKIDLEVRNTINSLYTKAVNLLKENREKLDLIANKLLEVEVLNKEEFEALFS